MWMTVLVIGKDLEHERPVSWLRQANALAPNPPRLYFPKPRHFGYILSAAEQWSCFWSDAANMFHSLPVPETARGIFPLAVISYDEYSGIIQEYLGRRFPKYATTGSQFRPM